MSIFITENSGKFLSVISYFSYRLTQCLRQQMFFVSLAFNTQIRQFNARQPTMDPGVQRTEPTDNQNT